MVSRQPWRGLGRGESDDTGAGAFGLLSARLALADRW